jgi:hypothetical protein
MNQFEHWHDLHRQEHAERAQAQRPENSPVRGSSRRSVYLALLFVGVLLLVGGYFAFTAEESATYGSIEQLAADMREGGVPCEIDFRPRALTFEEVGVCPAVGVTLIVFETANDLEAAVHPGSLGTALVGANWVVAPTDPDANIDDELQRIQDIVGGTLTEN